MCESRFKIGIEALLLNSYSRLSICHLSACWYSLIIFKPNRLVKMTKLLSDLK